MDRYWPWDLKVIMQTTYIILKIDHKAPIPDLTDLAAGRVYTMNNVEDVTAILMTDDKESHELIKALTTTANRS